MNKTHAVITSLTPAQLAVLHRMLAFQGFWRPKKFGSNAAQLFALARRGLVEHQLWTRVKAASVYTFKLTAAARSACLASIEANANIAQAVSYMSVNELNIKAGESFDSHDVMFTPFDAYGPGRRHWRIVLEHTVERRVTRAAAKAALIRFLNGWPPLFVLDDVKAV